MTLKHVEIKNILLLTLLVLAPQLLRAHCQIPCGIYDDHMRLQMMRENAATIEKSVAMMQELAGKTDIQSQNQMVRWVTSKEEHAQLIIETISNYYLTQRVKPDQANYGERLEKHHAVILLAMKNKQNADPKQVKALLKSIDALEAFYPEHKH